MAIEIKASTLPLSRVDRYVSRCSGAGQFARWVSVRVRVPALVTLVRVQQRYSRRPFRRQNLSQISSMWWGRHLIIFIIVSVIIVVSSGVDIGQGRAGNLFCLFMTSESEVDCCPSMLESKLQRPTNTDWLLLLLKPFPIKQTNKVLNLSNRDD